MERESKKKATPDINEEFMMNLMVDGVKKEGLIPSSESSTEISDEEKTEPENPPQEETPIRERNRKKKSAEINYEKIFLKKSETNARDGKTVYIRPEFHERLTRITQVIGEDKISIYAYLDNLLSHHFEEYAQQIIQSYNKKHKPIF